MLLNDKHAYSLWTHCPDLSECLNFWMSDLSECLICLNVWISECLICLNFWISECLICLNVWFVWMSEFLNVWMSECLICLVVWFTWLSVLPESLKVWWSDSSDSLICLTVWFVWFFWFQTIRQSDNQFNHYSDSLLLQSSDIQCFIHTAIPTYSISAFSGLLQVRYSVYSG